VIGWLIVLAGLAALIATGLSFRSHWRLELLAHFRPHLAVTALALALLAMVADPPTGMTVALVAALLAAAALNIFVYLSSFWPARVPPALAADAPRLRIGFANLYEFNRRYRPLTDWVHSEKPDIFIAAEALWEWPHRLIELSGLYAFATPEALGDLMVFTRWPATKVHLVMRDYSRGYAVVIEIETEHGPLTIVALHTRVPWHESPLGMYNLIGDVTELIEQRADAAIVVGDFNATPWSPPLRRLIERTGLAFGRDAWRGTFHAWLPSWMGIPIDLMLARGGWHVASRRPGPHFGSDHRPVIAEFVRHDGRKDPPNPLS
jgi:endonuclease/exonuclease/phosphatase (EEP) superfamily protein YafD